MKVLFIAHTAAPSGAELAMLRLATALRRVGSSPGATPLEVAAVFSEDGPVVDLMRERGIDATVLTSDFDNRAMTIGRSAFALMRGCVALITLGLRVGALAKRQGATVLVAESTKALLMGAVAAARAGIPLVWHVHDRVSADYFGRWLAAAIRVLGWAVSRGYIVNSLSTSRTVFRWRRQVLLSYPGLEPSPRVERAPQRDPAQTVVTMVARLTHWKGQDVLLRALAQAQARPARVYLVGGTHFGEQDYRAELERIAAASDIPVIFTGHVEDPRPYFAEADIAVHCSVLPEPFGQVVVEAMDAGCAVIAADAGGPREIIESGVNGLLVPIGDQHELAATLDRLIADVEVRRTLSAAATERAADFLITDIACEVAEYLTRLAVPRGLTARTQRVMSS